MSTWIMVGPGRVELPTSRLSGVRSNHLSYGPPVRTEARRSEVDRAEMADGSSPIKGRPIKSVRCVHEERETKTAGSRQNGP